MARRVILGVIGVVAFGVGIFLLCRTTPDPVYEGKSASAWFDDLLPSLRYNQQQIDAARTAIRALGTNAVPTMIARLQCRDSKIRKVLATRSSKEKILGFRLRPSAAELNLNGLTVAQVLGSDAEAALPYITPFLNDKAPAFRMWALNAIGRIGTNAQSAAPELFKLLSSDPDPRLRLTALHTLGYIRLPTDKAFPAATIALSDSSHDVRTEVMQWFMGRYIKPSKLAPIMIGQLRNSDPMMQTAALRELAWMKDEATNAVPIIEQLLDAQDFQVKLAARGALEKLTGKPFKRATNEDASLEYNFARTPIAQVLQEYKSLVNKPVRVPTDIERAGLIEFYTVGQITKSEAIALIESALKNQLGVIVVPTEDGALQVKRSADGR